MDENKKGPINKVLSPGSYKWCTCGLTNREPICDMSHLGTESKPLIFEIKERQEVWLCTCKKTKTPPYCDGTHKTL